MKRPIIKLTAAAAIVIFITLGITILDHAATPAWAIEETIELLEGLNGMHFKGSLINDEGEEVRYNAWARANEEQTGSNHLRIEMETGAVDVVSGPRRYEYDPATSIVRITEGYGPAMSPWLGAHFFEKLKAIVPDWDETYGKDPATNRDRVFVTCSLTTMPSPRSWWFEFDTESKLLVRMKQWENLTREGVPRIEMESITFLETLPDELFDFEIPEGATIVDKFPCD